MESSAFLLGGTSFPFPSYLFPIPVARTPKRQGGVRLREYSQEKGTSPPSFTWSRFKIPSTKVFIGDFKWERGTLHQTRKGHKKKRSEFTPVPVKVG